MARRRRKYSFEFKREAVRLVQEENLSPAQVGRDLGVDRSVISAWLKKAESGELAEGSKRCDSFSADSPERAKSTICWRYSGG